MAAGAIALAHDSGGPKLDIVIDYEGKPTGFLAKDEDGYASQLHAIFKMSTQEKNCMISNARKSVVRFSESNFEAGFLSVMEQFEKLK